MGSKYVTHINPYTLKSGVCRAKYNCRWSTVHLDKLTTEQKMVRTAEAYKIATSVIPRDENSELFAYYEATDKKHFGNKVYPGSKFTDLSLKKLEDVVALAAYQRGGLHGDDKDKFISLGASENAFKKNNRYLFVTTPGTVGILHSSALDDQAVVEIVRTKPGAPCSVVHKVNKQVTTEYAVVIISDDANPVVITSFPGLVTESLDDSRIDALEGETIPIETVRKILNRDIWMNTKLVN